MAIKGTKYEQIGAFSIGPGTPDVPMVQAVLCVVAGYNDVQGLGILTQTSPPLHGNNAFGGSLFGPGPHTDKQIYTLLGAPLMTENLPDIPHVRKCAIMLDGAWGTTGTASYVYFANMSLHEVKDTPVKVTWMAMPPD